MTVIVTGGSGLVGGYVLSELLEHGFDVINVDLRPSGKRPDVPFRQVDLMDGEATRAVINGADAVVHLAAIPNPNSDPGERVMSVNMASTYNVLEAVRENGIGRIVYGCSESASGFGIHRVEHVPLYLPIDEEHPCWPHETYSFTKYFGELMCREYARAYGIEVVSLRYGWVWFREHRESLAELLADRSPRESLGFFGAYVFAEDVARAVRLSLDFGYADRDTLFEAFYIMAGEPFYTGPTMEAVRKALGDRTPPVKPSGYFERDARAPTFSIDKAKRLLGYEPKYSCTDM